MLRGVVHGVVQWISRRLRPAVIGCHGGLGSRMIGPEQNRWFFVMREKENMSSCPTHHSPFTIRDGSGTFVSRKTCRSSMSSASHWMAADATCGGQGSSCGRMQWRLEIRMS